MTFSSIEFLTAFPEFDDSDVYPTPVMEYWASIADLRLNESRWGALRTHGIYLFVAHNIALARSAQDAANIGASVTQGGGLISSKSVGGVSVSYDTGSAALQNAGNYNLTRYGRELLQLARMVGIGGLQLLSADIMVDTVGAGT